MHRVAEIMTTNVVSLQQTDDIHQARMLLKEYAIRHLPVLDEAGKFVGLLTQRDILNLAFKVVENYGFSKLKAREQRTLVKDVMDTDCTTIKSSAALTTAGAFFVEHKHSCLPVVDDGELVGILTSVDFVKLCLQLLNQS
jgi:CBS domain-containing protein